MFLFEPVWDSLGKGSLRSTELIFVAPFPSSQGHKTHKYLQLEWIGPSCMVYILRTSAMSSFSKVYLERLLPLSGRHALLSLGVYAYIPSFLVLLL